MTTRWQRRKRSLMRGKRVYPFGVPRPKPTPVKYDPSQPSYEAWAMERTAREAEAQLALDEADQTPLDAEAQALVDAVFGDFVADSAAADEGTEGDDSSACGGDAEHVDVDSHEDAIAKDLRGGTPVVCPDAARRRAGGRARGGDQ